MRNDYFQAIREDAITLIRQEEENVLRKCLEECNFHDTFAYEKSLENYRITIYTSQPGIWIGKNGATFNKITNIIKSELGEKYVLKINRIKGRFISL